MVSVLKKNLRNLTRTYPSNCFQLLISCFLEIKRLGTFMESLPIRYCASIAVSTTCIVSCLIVAVFITERS